MGLCLSVAEALWKEKAFCADGRRTLRRVDEEDQDVVMRCGGSDYRLLSDGALEEAAAAAPPRSSGVLERAGGTPARPIWQRRVLMGVKCQLPRFSGMILYDERGRPVCSGIRDRARDQEKHAAAINMLRDAL
ncbi:hypothetical protein BRADI_3g10910v3 [Brachypodium distachyon]|uniref:Uncharacterized protein n=2 Tax=Brachypodium distachyon TaxID=15368 RepID=I1HZR3_BRADI|nr:hypothetical protein BRADI_3g10910v3 [Brachypodium distachyon]